MIGQSIAFRPGPLHRGLRVFSAPFARFDRASNVRLAALALWPAGPTSSFLDQGEFFILFIIRLYLWFSGFLPLLPRPSTRSLR